MTVEEIARVVGGNVEGDGSLVVDALATLEDARAGQLTFATDKYARQLAASKASAAIVNKVPRSGPMTLIRVSSVNAALVKLMAHWSQGEDLPPAGVHPSAVIDPQATLGRNVAIGPGAVVSARAKIGDGCVLCARSFIGSDVSIGPGTVIFEGAVIRHGCVIGQRCRIGPNAVIGFEGFGYHPSEQGHQRLTHLGSVEIGDDVDIGACTCVDRAKFSATRIGSGSKVDNLVQLAHNVVLEPGVIVAAMTGIAGSARVGAGAVIGGHSGVRDNISIGPGAQVGAFTGVVGDLEGSQAYYGFPAKAVRQALKEQAAIARLPELLTQVRQLEARLTALESSKND